MQQFNPKILDRLIHEAVPNYMAFLIGENGSGKSRILAELSLHLHERNYNVLAISNTPFSRFLPESYFKSKNYKFLLTGSNKYSPSDHIKQLLINSASEKNSNSIQNGIYGLIRILDYLGMSTRIGFSVEPRKEQSDILEQKLFRLPNKDYSLTRTQRYSKGIELALTKLYAKDGNPFLYAGQSYLKEIIDDPGRIEWIDLRIFMTDYRAEILRSLLYSEKEVKSLLDINVYVAKKYNNQVFEIDNISSGESSLFTTLYFINQNIGPDTWILIDEPENSLHPKWQKEYCENLGNFFSYSQPIVVVSTHSPMIVSGASEANLANIIYTAKKETPHKIRGSEGVESLLMDVFDTITPKNHYFSERAQILLDELANGRKSLYGTFKKIAEWREMTKDPNQLKFLEELEKLADKINDNRL